MINKIYLYKRYYGIISYSFKIINNNLEDKFLIKIIKYNLYNGIKALIEYAKVRDDLLKIKCLHDFDISLKMLNVIIKLGYVDHLIDLRTYRIWQSKISEVMDLMAATIVIHYRKNKLVIL